MQKTSSENDEGQVNDGRIFSCFSSSTQRLKWKLWQIELRIFAGALSACAERRGVQRVEGSACACEATGSVRLTSSGGLIQDSLWMVACST